MSKNNNKAVNVDEESIEEHLDPPMIQAKRKKYCYKPKNPLDIERAKRHLERIRFNFPFYNIQDQDMLIELAKDMIRFFDHFVAVNK